jgi:hypothetical protein
VQRVGVVIIVAAVAVHAVADSGGADRAAAEAKTRAANNDFLGAAAKYREAFQAEPRPDLMCNVGVAYYKAKDLPRAQRYLDQCLSIGTSLERTFIDNVKKVLAAVDSALAGGSYTPVDLLVQPPTATTTVEGGVPFDEPLLGSRRVWFPFGKYKLTVHAEGHVDRVVTIDAKDHSAIPTRVSLEVAPKPVDVGSAQEPDATSGSAIVLEPPPPPPPQVTTAKRSIVAPLVVSGATVGLGVAALGYYLAAVDWAEKAGEETSDRMRYDDLVDKARSRQHMSWLFSGAATAGAVVSGILWYRYSSAPRVEVQATGSSTAITLSGRW